VGDHFGRSHSILEGMHSTNVHTLLVAAADNESIGRVCRNGVLRPDDLIHQAQPPLPDRTGLRSIQAKGPGHLRPRNRLDHLLHRILDFEDPHLRSDLCVLASGI
jgi:hypothetical protein